MGANLPQHKAPMLKGKAFRMAIELEQPGENGVLVAQGGTAAGFALYQKDAKLWYAIRHGGKLSTVSGDVPDASGEISFHQAKNGDVVVKQGDAVLLKGRVPGPLKAMPIDGLQVGLDQGGTVGQYDGEFPFDGTIKRIKLEIE